MTNARPDSGRAPERIPMNPSSRTGWRRLAAAVSLTAVCVGVAFAPAAVHALPSGPGGPNASAAQTVATEAVDAPSISFTIPGNGQAAVYWTAPASPLTTDYSIQYRVAG